MPQRKIKNKLLKFDSVFTKLFVSVMLALILFAFAMVVLTHLVHDTSTNTRHQVIASQVTQQLEPLLFELRTARENKQSLEGRYLLALVRRSFNVYSESLNAKFGLYDGQSHEAILIMRGLPPMLPPKPPWFSAFLPAGDPQHPTNIQITSQSGYVVLYESKRTGRPPISPAINLITGTLLLLLIMSAMLWFIARTMTWRINQLSRQITQLGDGDFSARVTPVGNDEITILANGFNQTAERIETLMNANKLLLAHASHEIRTPITRIRLQVEMMGMLASQLDTKAQEKFAKRADAINRDLTGLNDLVESILLVSRMDAGHAIEKTERVDMYELIKGEVQHYPQATFIGSHVVIDGQSKLLTHLIRNLLDNAHLHGVPPVEVQLYAIDDDGNTLDLPFVQSDSGDPEALSSGAADNTEIDQTDEQAGLAQDGSLIEAQIEKTKTDETENVEAKSADRFSNKIKSKTAIFSRKKPSTSDTPIAYERIRIAVIDQGEGIPIDKRVEIFSPFVRLQQEKKGSGLGLSLVSQIVNAHKGTIITDTLDGHTRFLITLPAAQD